MAVTIMDTRNAEVLATSWYLDNANRIIEYKNLSNHNFINHPIGSCFKPLLYFTSFRRYPALAGLSLTSQMVRDYNAFNLGGVENQQRVTILGYPTRSFYGDSRGPGENLATALAKSSNLFPAISFLYSVTEERPGFQNDLQNGRYPNSLYRNGVTHSDACTVIDNELYMNGLARNTMPELYKAIFSVDEMNLLVGDRDMYCYSYWNSHYTPSGEVRPDRKLMNYGVLSPEQVTLRFDVFNDQDGNAHAGSFRDEMIPWILGSQNNRWNNVKLCEAFSRVITGVDNRGKIEKIKTDTAIKSSLFDITRNIATLQTFPEMNAFSNAHVSLLNALDSRSHGPVTRGSTWVDVGNIITTTRVPGISSPLVIMAKTGTANDETYGGKTYHHGAFMFSIMTQMQYESLQRFIRSGYQPALYPQKLGITGVISLELTDRLKESPVFYSKYARLFMNNQERIADLIILNKHLF
jgi:hypothetical protein